MPRLFAFCLALFLQFPLLAQDFDNYKPLRAEGDMPSKFITSSTEKFRKDLEKKINAKDKRHERKAKEQFLLESNFRIDQLLLSGKVLFNDPVTLYINKVLDEILKHEPKLRGEIEAYAVKSPAVNAFATDNGIILVNIGLIAHLQNEAELAYILCHEVIHYKKQHSLDEYVESAKIEKGRGSYRGSSMDERLLARSNYSKEKESEADLDGLKIFLRSNYSVEALNDVFDVLEYAHLPYADIEFEKSFLERGSLVISPQYWLDKTDSIEAQEEDDSLSTHPAVSRRRAAVQELIDSTSGKGKKNFIIGEEEFRKIRKICRFESTVQFMQNMDFESALYNSYLLLKEEPGSSYLQKNIFESLYGLAKYANATELGDVHTDPDDMSGSSQRVNYLFEEISAAELSLTALVHGWLLKKQFPDDKKLSAQVDDILNETIRKHYPERNFFSSDPRPIDTVKVENEVQADGSSDENDEKAVKKKKKKKKKKKESDMAKYALVELLQDPDFVKQYDQVIADMNKKIVTKKKGRKKAGTDTGSESANVSGTDESGTKNKDKKPAISSMIIVNPYYYYIRETRKQAVRYTESEAGQEKFSELVKSTAEKVGISYTMLDSKDLTNSSTSLFNEIATLNEYINLVSKDGDINRLIHLEEELLAVKAKYNTRYVCWTGVLAVQEKDGEAGNNFGAACLFPPYLPIAIYKAIAPNYQTYFYTLVLDLETGKTAYATSEAYSMRDYSDVMRGTLYYTMASIKAGAKKK